MTEQEVKELLIKTNAIMEGHFLLTSGLHSPMYVEKFNVLQQPKYTEQLCKALAEYFADKNIDTVVGPMTGGILLAHEVGKALGTRAIFTERVDVVKAEGAIPVGVGLLVDRSGGKATFEDVPAHALLHLDVTTYKPEECPLCHDNVPMTKRGRTGK